MQHFHSMDWIPVLSQVKSLVQAVSGDTEGARITQENFSKQCPIVSQSRSAAEAVFISSEAARKTQLEFLTNVKDVGYGVVTGTPGVGHAVGAVQYAAGFKSAADATMKSASRTTGVIIGGMAGFTVGGPAGAIAGGIVGGTTMDGVTTGVESAIHQKFMPNGQVSTVVEIKKKIDNGENVSGAVFDATVGVVMDGVTGYGAGKAVQKAQMDSFKSDLNDMKNQVKNNLKESKLSDQVVSKVTDQIKDFRIGNDAPLDLEKMKVEARDHFQHEMTQDLLDRGDRKPVHKIEKMAKYEAAPLANEFVAELREVAIETRAPTLEGNRLLSSIQIESDLPQARGMAAINEGFARLKELYPEGEWLDAEVKTKVSASGNIRSDHVVGKTMGDGLLKHKIPHGDHSNGLKQVHHTIHVELVPTPAGGVQIPYSDHTMKLNTGLNTPFVAKAKANETKSPLQSEITQAPAHQELLQNFSFQAGQTEGYIHFYNDTSHTVQVKMTNYSGGSDGWYPINSKQGDKWTRLGWDAVIVKDKNNIESGCYVENGTKVVFTGTTNIISYDNIHFNVKKLPDNVVNIKFANLKSYDIEVFMSNTSGGSNSWFLVKQGDSDVWKRTGHELVAVKDPFGARFGCFVPCGSLVEFI